MVQIIRIQALWSGFPGAPGYSNFHFGTDVITTTKINTAAAGVRAFFNSLSIYLPTGVQISQSGLASTYELNGNKTSEMAYTAPAVVTGSSATAYAGGTGAVVHWKTGTYNGGRPFIGRTFLVPFAGGYAADGTLTPAAITAVVTAANTLKAIVDPTLNVWSVNKATGLGRATAPAVAVVPDRTATLRSRR